MSQQVKPKKALGQHFLTDLDIARRIAATLDDYKGLPVMEVGPGMGVLTQFLMAEGHDISVAEIDGESVDYLRSHFPELEGRIIDCDFLKLDLAQTYPDGQPFCVIGNYPYNISSQIFFHVLDYRDQVKCCSGMLQREVAERLAAPAGTKTRGILSVMLQAWYDVEYLFTVQPGVFNPPPKVQSGVIRIAPQRRDRSGLRRATVQDRGEDSLRTAPEDPAQLPARPSAGRHRRRRAADGSDAPRTAHCRTICRTHQFHILTPRTQAMKEYTPEYLEHIRQIIAERNEEAARTELADLHPADIAELYQQLDLEEEEFLYKLLDDEIAADVLMELDEDDRRKLLKEMPAEEIARQFIENLDTDDAVDIIQELDEEDRDKILSHIDDVEQAGDIIDLLKYDEDTAGGLMGTEMIVVNENWSMPECIKQMRMQAEDMDAIYNVYVVDNDYRLRGILPLKTLITHPSVSKIRHVMEENPASVKTDTPIDDVAIDFEKYDLVAMPVVDSIGRLVGRITVDDVMDQVRESTERDYQLASGLSSDVETSDTIFTQTKARLPWLLIGMLGGIGNSLILGNFEEGLSVDPTLALFIPLIGGTGGNVGTQSSAIVVQGLANGSLDLRRSGRQLLKELGVGLINGLIISLLVLTYNVMKLGPGHYSTTMAVSLSLMSVVIFASVFGTFVPLTLEKFKIDPALATGPFISITNDIIGMLIYMVISSALIIHFAG